MKERKKKKEKKKKRKKEKKRKKKKKKKKKIKKKYLNLENYFFFFFKPKTSSALDVCAWRSDVFSSALCVMFVVMYVLFVMVSPLTVYAFSIHRSFLELLVKNVLQVHTV